MSAVSALGGRASNSSGQTMTTAQGEKARAGMAAGNGGNTQGKGCQILSPPPEDSDSSSDAD